MTNSNHFSERLRDPLNETTRKTRRNLMASALTGIIITKVGLVPEKISAFGIEFTSANQHALLMLLVAAIFYFALTFIVYAYSELTAWQLVFASKEIETLREEAEASMNETTEPHYVTFEQGMEEQKKYLAREQEKMRFKHHIEFLSLKSKPTFFVRLLIEIMMPIIFSAFACYSLITFELASETSSPSKPTTTSNTIISKNTSSNASPKKIAPPQSGASVN